ncbi:MAG: hypothetical protein WAJ97_13520 [Terriglobales bacterium]|jgi:hypothetical protein
MLAGVRCCFLLLFLLAFSVAVVLPVQAQVNGVPPSVTSMGFGGRVINGVPPSVTSFGPDGYNNRWSILGNCCANFLLPANPDPPLFSEHHHRHKDGASLAGVMEPVFVPIAVPYATEEDEDSPDVDADTASPENADSPIRPARYRDSFPMADTEENEEDSASTQPLTVLVFKDTHQSGVLNYAILGDTLFDFDEGRTRRIPLTDLDLPATLKVNDDRGVDFQIPAGAVRQ